MRRSNSRGSSVQILERRRMLSAAMDGRELAGLLGTGRAIEESIVARQSNSSSSSTKADSRIGQITTSIPEIAGSDSSRVITPRGSGSGTTMSKGPEGGGVLFMTGTGGDDHFVIGANGIQIVVELNGNPFIFDDTIYNSIDIDGLGGADTINVESNGANPTTLRGGAGEDLIMLTPTGGDLDQITASVLVDGGTDGAALELYDDVNAFGDTYLMTNNTLARDFFGGVSFGSLTSLALYCQSVGSAILVQSTPACPVTVSGGGGDDQCNVTESSENLENLGGPFTFNGGADADSITLYDTHNTFDDAWTMNFDTITRPFVDPIRCVAEDIRAIMGGGNNGFTLTDFTQPYLGVVGFDGNDAMVVNGVAATSTVDFAGGSGTNAISAERTTAGSIVNFLGEGTDDSMSLAYGSGDLSDVAGTVNYYGMTGSNDSITLWDDLNDAARNYTFELETFTRTGGFGQLNFYNISNVTLQATQGSNQINVNANASGTNLELSGNNGDDSVVFNESTGTLSSLAGAVNFIGGEGSDNLHFFDYFRSNSSTYTFTSTQLAGAGFATQTFSGIENAYLYAGDGANTINVSNNTAIQQRVFGGDGIDIIHVTETATPVFINGGDGLDQFNIGPNPNLNIESALTAQAVAVSNIGSLDQLSLMTIQAGCTLSIANQHTLACTLENVAGTLSFGQRSNYIAVAGTEPLFLSTALAYVSAGYNGGAWNGMNGSFSSHYSASSPAGDGIGYARASDIGVTTYNNFSVAANDLIFTQTRYGDANLDHTVNFNDLLKLAQNYNTANKFWFHGDFDYNQSVNFADLLRTAQNYGQSAVFSDRRVGSMADSVLRDS